MGSSNPSVIGMLNAQRTKYLQNTGLGIGLNLMQQLNANQRDVFMLVQGDSTGNEKTEWVYLTAQFLASQFPEYSVKYYLYNSANNNYDAPESITIGTGANVLHVYNSSVAGSSALYFTGHRKTASLAGNEYDLIIQNFGHNQASESSLNIITFRLIESVSQLIADNPDSEIVLTLQNIDTSLEVFSARQVQATKTVAELFGLGVLDVRSVFRYRQKKGSLANYMGDVVHPNVKGSKLWAKVVTDALTNPVKYMARKINSLSMLVSSPVPNAYFSSWSWQETLPTGWGISSTTNIEKEFVIKETGNWSVKVSGNDAGSIGSLLIDIPDYLLKRQSGVLTFMARVYVPSSNTTQDAGRIEVTTDKGNAVTSQYAEVVDGWTWRIVQVPTEVLKGATTLRLSIMSGVLGDCAYIDMVNVVEGRLPFSPAFPQGTLSDYYDPSNVAAKGDNNITVTDNSVTLNSTGAGYPTFHINVFDLVPNEKYTITWDYVGGGAGTMLARQGLNDSGTPIAQQNPLSGGSLSWFATSTSGSLQVSNSRGFDPFTLNNIKITKG